MRRLWFTIPVAALLLLKAGACPVCSTENGKQVRDGIVGEKLPISVMATMAPWIAIASIVAAGLVLTGGKVPKTR